MKKIILNILPESLLRLYRKYTNAKRHSRFLGKAPTETFKQIYESNHWRSNESISGTGSDELQTQTVVIALNSLLKNLNVSSILDLPCGDFNWMKKVDLSEITYKGADIVEEIVLKNQTQYAKDNEIQFIQLNLIDDPLPKSDIIINRDCLVHLSYEDIYYSIKNIKTSGCKYLLTTTFINHHFNEDITTGDWRTLNLQKKPFNFPAPLLVINENCTEQNGIYSDKSLGLWLIDDLIVPNTIYK